MESEGKQNPGTLRLQFPWSSFCGWITFRHSSRACDNRGAQTRRWKYGQGYEGGNEFKTKNDVYRLLEDFQRVGHFHRRLLIQWSDDVTRLAVGYQQQLILLLSDTDSCTRIVHHYRHAIDVHRFHGDAVVVFFFIWYRVLPKQIINKKKGQTFHRQKNKTTQTKRGPSWPTESK